MSDNSVLACKENAVLHNESIHLIKMVVRAILPILVTDETVKKFFVLLETEKYLS